MNKEKVVIERRIPKQKRSIEKVQRILDCAAKLMSEHGPENISTHQVAACAGIAVGSLYQFFPNIETVKIALVERVMNTLFDKTIEALKSSDSGNIADVTSVLIDVTLDIYHQHLDVVRTILVSRHSEAFQSVNEKLNERLINSIFEYVKSQHENKDEGELLRKVRVSILLGDVMTMLVWTAKDAAERDAYIQEWKELTQSYVSLALK